MIWRRTSILLCSLSYALPSTDFACRCALKTSESLATESTKLKGLICAKFCLPPNISVILFSFRKTTKFLLLVLDVLVTLLEIFLVFDLRLSKSQIHLFWPYSKERRKDLVRKFCVNKIWMHLLFMLMIHMY